MLFALLFNGNDELIAAAPAVFQYTIGDAYWRDAYAGEVSDLRNTQTAHVDVTDDDLIDKLNSLEFDDQHLVECRRRVDELSMPKRELGKRPRAA